MVKKLLIATTQKGKLIEFKAILKNLKFRLLTLNDLNFPKLEPQETGLTFSQNAVIKAKFYGQKSKLLTLADDSGLIVKALPNKLGVLTKRFSNGTDKNRWQQLLNEMKNIPLAKRRAKFISAVCFFDPKTKILKIAQGECEGTIAFKPKGSHGFGYDPIFIVKSINKYFGELTLTEKNLVSHRAKALKTIKKLLKEYEN